MTLTLAKVITIHIMDTSPEYESHDKMVGRGNSLNNALFWGETAAL